MILRLKGVNSKWLTEIIIIKEKQRPTVRVNKKKKDSWGFLNGKSQGGKTKRRSDCASVNIGSCLIMFNNDLLMTTARSKRRFLPLFFWGSESLAHAQE